MAPQPKRPAPSEQKLDMVLELIRGLTIKLFGDMDSENDRGRLPSLEKTVDKHDERIRRLENLAFRVGGAFFVLGALAQILSLVWHHN